MTTLETTVDAIRPADGEAMAAARERQSRLTKPAGSLGALEDLSVRLAGLAGTSPPPLPDPAAVAVFAGDHGVHAQRVSPWPQEVTAQMVANFLAGGAVVNAFARQTGARVVVVDVGVATPTSITVTDAPTWRANAFTTAPPARKFATIWAVTSCGHGLTPWACTPWSPANTATAAGSGSGGGHTPASPDRRTESGSRSPSEPAGLVSRDCSSRATAMAGSSAGRIAATVVSRVTVAPRSRRSGLPRKHR